MEVFLSVLVSHWSDGSALDPRCYLFGKSLSKGYILGVVLLELGSQIGWAWASIIADDVGVVTADVEVGDAEFVSNKPSGTQERL